jgi:hypothetical protein
MKDIGDRWKIFVLIVKKKAILLILFTDDKQSEQISP